MCMAVYVFIFVFVFIFVSVFYLRFHLLFHKLMQTHTRVYLMRAVNMIPRVLDNIWLEIKKRTPGLRLANYIGNSLLILGPPSNVSLQLVLIS